MLLCHSWSTPVRIRIGRDRIFILVFFVSLILVGSFALSIPGMFLDGRLSYVDALFTSTSAVCVTGLITVDTARFSLAGQSVILALIQAGGLGIITLATFFIAIPRRRISIVSRGMISDYAISEVEHQPKTIVKAIVKYTLVFEAIGALIYYLRFSSSVPRPGFVSVFHAVSAFCNAGFSTFTTSLEAYVFDPLVSLNTIWLIVSGGIGFIVIKDVRNFALGKKHRLSTHSSVVLGTSAALILFGTICFLLLEYRGIMRGFTLPQKLLASFFQAATPRTAGFDTLPQASFGQGSRMLTMILMFIGASPASTGGGVKTSTFFILVMTAFRYKEKSEHIAFGGRNIQPSLVFKAVGVVIKGSIIVLTISALILLVESAHGAAIGMAECVFETISAFGTVGLSLGLTSSLHPASKLLIVVTMFVGRVGLFAIALPKTDRDVEGYAGLPSADIMI
ncbi:MAG TPA: potassium transporter TrkG [Rectinemataceae bacterium]